MTETAILPETNAEDHTRLIGVSAAARAAIIEEKIRHSGPRIWFIVASTASLTESLAEDLKLFRRASGEIKTGLNCLILPELPENSSTGPGNFEPAGNRLATLSALQDFEPGDGESLVVLTTPRALDQAFPSPDSIRNLRLSLHKSASIPFGQCVETLTRFDYDAESICEAPGQMAIRGGILDVYPATGDRPYRVDFFGDEIDSIRAFDPVTQRSGDPVDTLLITPSPTMDLPESADGIAGFLPSNLHWMLVEPDDLTESFSEQARDDDSTVWDSWRNLCRNRQKSADLWVTVSDLDLDSDDSGTVDTVTYDAESLELYRSYPDESRIADERLMDEQAARRTAHRELRPDRHPIHFQGGRWRGQGAALPVRRDHLPGADLGGFHVGLVERVHPQPGPGHDGGNLPQEELVAQVVGIRQWQTTGAGARRWPALRTPAGGRRRCSKTAKRRSVAVLPWRAQAAPPPPAGCPCPPCQGSRRPTVPPSRRTWPPGEAATR